jgi:hypothetical protein
MGLASDLVMYGRFGLGLRRFLREPITLDRARAVVRRRLVEREANFLRVARKGIFGYERSPHLGLLRAAGCEYGDLEAMVRSRGIEGSLRALREAGVYFTFEEFKGREPVVRNGRTLPIRPHAFDNPYVRSAYYGESGGTTGAGTRVYHDLDHMAEQIPLTLLSQEAHGTLGMPRGIWRGVLPNIVGLSNLLGGAKMGNVPRRWFSPVMPGDRRVPLKYRLATEYVLGMGRLSGVAFPRPEPVRLEEAGIIARWMAETIAADGGCYLGAFASMALRVAIAALDEGIDLTGGVFSGGGEPPTPAKTETIRKTGARVVPTYYFSEAGAVGLPCAHPVDCNDQHFMRDHLALIQHARRVPGTEIEVNAFLFTTLLPSATKILLNVESDDYGTIEARKCGCLWEKYGFPEHIRHIRSFRKLTGEGMTLVGSEMERILQQDLPRRFGGTALDYQLLEEEDSRGFTRLSVVVSPRIDLPDEQQVIDTVLAGLRRGSEGADGARATWAQARSFRVRRIEPIWTARGKLMPLHLVGQVRGESAEPVPARLHEGAGGDAVAADGGPAAGARDHDRRPDEG